jgi:hypothetical protein
MGTFSCKPPLMKAYRGVKLNLTKNEKHLAPVVFTNRKIRVALGEALVILYVVT